MLAPEIAAIVFHWSESNVLKDNTVCHTLEEAEALLAKVGADAPVGGGYCKTKYSVAVAHEGDLHVYTGRYDVTPEDCCLKQNFADILAYNSAPDRAAQLVARMGPDFLPLVAMICEAMDAPVIYPTPITPVQLRLV